MSDIGVKVSLAGVGVTEATPEESSVYPGKPSLLAEEANVGVDSYTFSSNPGTDTTTNLLTVSHGYDFVPAAVVLIEDVTVGQFTMLPHDVSGGLGTQMFVAYCTSTDLKLDFVVTDPVIRDVDGDTFNIKYWIFAADGR